MDDKFLITHSIVMIMPLVSLGINLGQLSYAIVVQLTRYSFTFDINNVMRCTVGVFFVHELIPKLKNAQNVNYIPLLQSLAQHSTSFRIFFQRSQILNNSSYFVPVSMMVDPNNRYSGDPYFYS